MTTTTDTREAARARLLELLAKPPDNWKPEQNGNVLKVVPELRQATVWAVTRFQSRTRGTSVIDFLVIRDNRPTSISREILQVLPEDLSKATKGRFSIPPGNEYTGLVLTKNQPEDIVNRLSMALFGRYCLDIEVL
jgi:hypothetical protein